MRVGRRVEALIEFCSGYARGAAAAPPPKKKTAKAPALHARPGPPGCWVCSALTPLDPVLPAGHSVTVSAQHLYLSIPRSHLSNSLAVKVVLTTIREVVPETATSTDAQLHRETYTINSPAGDSKSTTFADLVAEAKATGVVQSLRIATDHADPIFGGGYGFGVSENMTIKTEYLGHAIEAKGPGHTYPVGRELVEDILFYRRETCACSSMQALSTVGRLYRAYTLCCTTLVEAYLNRHLWYFRAIGRVTTEQVEDMPLKFEHRIAAWSPLFTSKKLSDLKAVKPCWGHLVELRRQRNQFRPCARTDGGPLATRGLPRAQLFAHWHRWHAGEASRVARVSAAWLHRTPRTSA